MSNSVKYEDVVIARLFDFFSSKSPWHRGLWTIGLVLTLKELIEACDANRAGVLSEHSVKQVATAALTMAGTDPGVGGPEEHRLIQSLIASHTKAGSLNYLALQLVAERIDSGYLERWAQAVLQPSSRPKAERTARAVASHLLDSGFSKEFLHRWLAFNWHHAQVRPNLHDVLLQAHQLILSPPRDYVALVAFESLPPTKMGFPTNHLKPEEVAAWLDTNGFSREGIRQGGGLILKLSARDQFAATEMIREAAEAVVSRSSVAANHRLSYLKQTWIAGEKASLPLGDADRGVSIKALDREGQAYGQTAGSIVDAAIELLAPLQNSSPGAAVAGGWAAIEALLSDSHDRAGAADRLAKIVTCSFPRAELTALAYTLRKSGHLDANQLDACRTNRERAAFALKNLDTLDLLAVPRDSDVAAILRMKEIVKDAYARLQDIEKHLSSTLQRLYRNRNMVLHWGKIDALTLRSCLRTAAPLVGAGMDRVAHAWYLDQVKPLMLAAKATISLATITASNADACVHLLE